MNNTLLLALVGVCGVLFGLIDHNGFAQIKQSSTFENNTDGMKYFENRYTGLSFTYPSEWGNPADDFYMCVPENVCDLSWIKFDDSINSFGFQVRAVNLNKPFQSSGPCNCDTLKDFAAWYYKHIKENVFINDNQTSIGKNYSAWQIETKSINSIGEVVGLTKLNILSFKDNFGYMFSYMGPTDGDFDRYLDGFKNMLKSVQLNPPRAKAPSFIE